MNRNQKQKSDHPAGQKRQTPEHGHTPSWRFQLEEQKKAQSLYVIQQAVQLKHIRRRPSFVEKLWNQLRFQPWQHRAVQGGLLLLSLLVVSWIYRTCQSDTDSVAVCSVLLVLTGNLCLSSIAHLFSWKMAELEKTLYLDLRQMVCIRMLEAGIFDLLILCILTGCLGTRFRMGILAYLFYLLVPFLWSEFFYLHMLTHIRSMHPGFRQFSSSILSGMPVLFPVCWRDAYLPEYIPVWGMLSAAGAALLTVEISCMLQKIDTGESIC